VTVRRVSVARAEELVSRDAAQPREEPPAPESPLTPHALLELQRTGGNRAVQRLLAAPRDRTLARFSDQLVRERADQVKDWIEAKVQVRAHEIFVATGRNDEQANYFEAKKQVEEAWQHLTTLKSGGVITREQWAVMKLGLSSDEYATALALIASSPAASLADRLIAGLELPPPTNYDTLIQAIHGASVAERRAALRDVRVRERARDRLSKATAVTLMSSLLEGSQDWKNPADNDFFDYFVTQKGTGTLPSAEAATMNCWEMILYSAYLVGAIGQPWIEQFYTDALAEPDPNVLIWQRLGWTAALPQYPAQRPTAGQLLFYFTGGTYPGHVAISLGGDDAVSLWDEPRGDHATQRIRVAELGGTVYVGNPPW
jgi:hypothetical protein